MQNIAGLVLAAGGSSRMGQDKTLLQYNGQSFLELAVAQLNAAGVAQSYVNNADNLADIIADKGPIGGIYSALQTYQTVEHWLIIPNDMPLLTAEILQTLLAGLGGADIVRFEGEMFPILLKTSDIMLNKITELATDELKTYSLRQFMKPFRVAILPKPLGSELAFSNINSPQDYKRIVTGHAVKI